MGTSASQYEAGDAKAGPGSPSESDRQRAIKIVSTVTLHWLPPPLRGFPDMAANANELIGALMKAIVEEREACARIADEGACENTARMIRDRGNP